MPNDATGSLDFDPNASGSGGAAEAEPPDNGGAGQDPTEALDETASPGASESTETQDPQDGERETSAILKGFDPEIPPIDRAQWKKLYNDVRTTQGRLRTQAQRGAEVSEQTATRARMYQELAAIPGLTDFVLGGHKGQAERMAKGLQQLAGYFRVDPASLLGGASQGEPAQQQRQDGPDWTQIKDPNKLRAYWEEIADRRAEAIVQRALGQHVVPMYRNQERMQRESEIARLTQQYPDLPKYKAQIGQYAEKHPEMSTEDAYFLAKAKGGGYRTRTPNPALAVSEEPNARGDSQEVDIDKALQMMTLGANGRKGLDF